jgi:preprotein translocase subunit SecG
LKYILIGVQALSVLLLIALVLLHSPKGDGVSAMMSGAGSIFASQKGAEATLNKLTAYTAGIFFLVSFVLGYYVR